MPLEYDDSALEKGQQLLKQQKATIDSVADLLKKAKDGYVGNADQVLKSGLKKAEVSEVLQAHAKNKPVVKQIEAHKRAFETAVRNAYTARKANLETQLKNLKTEYEAELKKFPSSNRDVLSSAAEGYFKQALEKMD